MTFSLTDPFLLLLVITSLVGISIFLPKLRAHWPLWAWVLWRIFILIALTLLILRILGSPLQPRFTTTHASLQFWEQLIEATWWVIAAQAAVGIARILVVLENRPRETKIVSDLLAGAIYIATFLAIINFSFNVPIRGLLATSGVIAIVLGLALQSTLSDVFSGIAVGLERSYKAGDLLWVEGGIEGHVVQVNWRSTHIATAHHNVAIVPNSIIAKARLINRSAPTPVRGDAITVSLDAGANAETSVAALNAAACACRIPMTEPAPNVACTGLHGDGIAYEISFYVETSDQLRKARDELFMQVHRHLYHAGVALAVPNVANPPQIQIPSLQRLLERSDLFGVLGGEERKLLAEHFTLEWLNPTETLIREGEFPDALFIIASGTAKITVSGSGGPRVVYKMSPGESLGAVGLINGTPYVATATALTPLKAYRLDKSDIAAAIKTKPELAVGLEMLAKRGQAILSRNAAVVDNAQQIQSEMFLPRLRNFLRLLAT